MNIGDALKEYRNRLNLSQAEIAKRMSVTQQTVAQYENNKRIPKADTLKKFASALEVPYKTLIEKIVVPRRYLIHPSRIPSLSFEELEIAITVLYSLLEIYENFEYNIDFISDALEILGSYMCDFEIERNKRKNDISYRLDEKALLCAFEMLNNEGKDKLFERAVELSELDRYSRTPQSENIEKLSNPETREEFLKSQEELLKKALKNRK